MTDNKHTPGELYLSDSGTMGELTIVIRPVPEHGGDIIAEAPEEFECSMRNWRANAARIVKTWNEYGTLKAELEAAKQREAKLREALEVAHTNIRNQSVFLSDKEWQQITEALNQ